MAFPREMRTLSGLATARGLAAGPVFLYRGYGDMPVPEYAIEFGQEGDELLRFKRAVNEAKRDLESLIAVLKRRSGREDVKIFECHEMLLEDPSMTEEVTRAITSAHVNAESAVRRVIGKYRAQFERMNDPYFRSRVRDIDDVERRLLKSLTGYSLNPCQELKTPSIIIADDLTPSETVQLPQEFVLGFATNGGSSTSHVALLARAMGIPAITGMGSITSSVEAGETILLDGTRGQIVVSPDEATEKAFRQRVQQQMMLIESFVGQAKAGQLKDGSQVLLFANVHPGVPMDTIGELGARGIGLYRSEYLWLNGDHEPTEEEQYAAYREAAELAATLSPHATVTIRALDIGGDKLVRSLSNAECGAKETNPFLGNRSIRYLLSHRDMMRTQLRAILRASVHGRVCLMYPMISCEEELIEAAAEFEAAKRSLEEEGVPFKADIPIGAMIEVPAAALNATALAKHVSFFSIGTNDLVQYTMAADRTNEAVASLYQPLNPAVLRLVEMTVASAKQAGVFVAVCGESASDPLIGALWAAMGVDMLSLSATYIPMLARLFAQLTQADLAAYRACALEAAAHGTAADVTTACRAWMSAKIPDLSSYLQ